MNYKLFGIIECPRRARITTTSGFLRLQQPQLIDGKNNHTHFARWFFMPPPGVEIPLILFKSHVGNGFVFDAPRGGCVLNYFSSFFLVFPPLLVNLILISFFLKFRFNALEIEDQTRYEAYR